MADMVGGALVAEALKLVIAEAKKVKAFKSLFKKLTSSMEKLIPLTENIDAIRGRLDLDVGELKELRETIERAKIVVDKCSRVRWFHLFSKSKLQREIVQVNEDMLEFCGIDLQLIQHNCQLLSMEVNNNNFQIVIAQFEVLNEKVDGLIVPAQPVVRDLCSAPKPGKVVGLNWPLKELKMKLLNDSVNTLVVSASFGGGKTTLVTQLCHDEDIKREFKNIFFTVVTSTPNFRAIVRDLLQHNGYGDQTFENDHQAGIALRNLLERLKENSRKTLLVLDDVWNGAESWLIQKFGFSSPDFKILVTSLFEFQSFGPTYHLKPLEEGYAKALFIQWASRPDHASPAEYEELLQRILKRCGGIPILIEVVGVSLKERSLQYWKGQVESWSEGETILDINPYVLECLEPSFNALNHQLKECFLDMGSFLEDQKIRASVIIDMWVGLYGKGSTVCMKYLEDFASQNLLKVVPLGSNKHEAGFYNEFLVTQQNTLRELALRHTKSEAILERKRLNLEIRENKFPGWCPPHCIINASLLSISTDDLFSSSWVEMKCPNVEALVLNLSSSLYELPSFITEMKKLKVLIITNHSSSSARLSNLSCLSSLPNLKRIRFEKVSITLLDITKLGLKSLEKLSLWLCPVVEVLNEPEVDVSETLQGLQEIEIDYCYNLIELPYWISQVVSLKKLSVTNCNKLCRILETIGNLRNLETLRLSSCPCLLELPETVEKLSKLRVLDVSGAFQLKKLPLEVGNLQNLEKILMRDCYRCVLPDSVKKLKNLEVKCDEKTALPWKTFKPKMMNLTITEEETEHSLNFF